MCACPSVVGEPPRAGAVDGHALGGGVEGVVVAPVVADGVVSEVEGALIKMLSSMGSK